MNDATEVPIRPASSVVLARDTDSGISAGIELFMLERTSAAVFAGGMHVFPGGRVDEADHDPEYQQFAVGPDLAQRAQVAAVGENALGFWIAAIRECFEEAGFLLAYDAEGRMLELADEVTVARFVAHRAALNDGTLTMLQMCRMEQLKLAIDHLHYYHTWITPPGRPRRFNTRFFLASVPATQEGIHDNMETVSSHWITPADALARHADGKFGLMPVTKTQLQAFAVARDSNALVDMARTAKQFPVYRPMVPTDN